MAVQRVLILMALLGAGVAGQADTLLLEGLEASQGSAADRPMRGMSMDSVESRFGVPRSRHEAVGDPPISRWDYTGFVVYFEYQYVIHAVASRTAAASN